MDNCIEFTYCYDQLTTIIWKLDKYNLIMA
jgi:hypothetical protein